MLEFVEVTEMDHCALCGALIVRRERGVEASGHRYCSGRCVRVSAWYAPVADGRERNAPATGPAVSPARRAPA